VAAGRALGVADVLGAHAGVAAVELTLVVTHAGVAVEEEIGGLPVALVMMPVVTEGLGMWVVGTGLPALGSSGSI
jgi:hypothetical protein